MKPSPPLLPPDDPDRLLEAEQAVDEVLARVVDSMVRAGWKQAEIDVALVRVALARQAGNEANADIDDFIRRQWLAIHGEEGRSDVELREAMLAKREAYRAAAEARADQLGLMMSLAKFLGGLAVALALIALGAVLF